MRVRRGNIVLERNLEHPPLAHRALNELVVHAIAQTDALAGKADVRESEGGGARPVGHHLSKCDACNGREHVVVRKVDDKNHVGEERRVYKARRGAAEKAFRSIQSLHAVSVNLSVRSSAGSGLLYIEVDEGLSIK